MHKGFLRSLVLAVGLIFGFCVSFCFAEESITITTYYPSPYGVYNELQLYGHSPPITTCDDVHKGTMYYDSNDNQVYVCKGTALGWKSIGEGACSDDFTDTGYGYCIQTNENSARTWYAASDYCADNYNARLCTSSEWYNACVNNKASAMIGNWEWVDSWNYYGSALVRGLSNCDSVDDYYAADYSYPFRCCRGK